MPLPNTQIQTHGQLAINATGYFSNAFETRDNKYLKYDYCKAKGHNTYQGYTDNFVKALKREKLQQPRIDLQAGTIQGVLADFDEFDKIKQLSLPAQFSKDWSSLRRWLTNKFWNGCVFQSASGKAKIFFPLTFPGITTIKGRNILKKLLGDTYFEAVDKNSVRYSFINTEAYKTLSSWLKSLDYTLALTYNNKLIENQVAIEKESRDIVNTSSTYKWICSTATVPENMLDNLKTKTNQQHIITAIQYMLGSKMCIDNSGVAIPVVLLAEAMESNIMSASRTLKTMIKLNVIKKVNNAIIGHRAACYCFCGFWLVWAKGVVKEAPKASHGGLKAIVETITDGNWNEPLFKMTNYFKSEADYLSFVQKLPNFEAKPDRLGQAKNSWKSHIKLDYINKNKLKYA